MLVTGGSYFSLDILDFLHNTSYYTLVDSLLSKMVGGIFLLSRIKQWFDSHQREESDMDIEELQPFQTKNQEFLPRLHMEFFYFHPQLTQQHAPSDKEMAQLPVMCITVHFMEEDKRGKRIPYSFRAIFTGLEETLTAMKVPYHKVDQPHLYSILVDTRSYPQQEVKNVLHVVVRQLSYFHRHDDQTVTVRAHVGGDELYHDLINAYQEEEAL